MLHHSYDTVSIHSTAGSHSDAGNATDSALEDADCASVSLRETSCFSVRADPGRLDV